MKRVNIKVNPSRPTKETGIVCGGNSVSSKYWGYW